MKVIDMQFDTRLKCQVLWPVILAMSLFFSVPTFAYEPGSFMNAFSGEINSVDKRGSTYRGPEDSEGNRIEDTRIPGEREKLDEVMQQYYDTKPDYIPPKLRVCIGFPNVSWSQYNKFGDIKRFRGFNLLLGYSELVYFNSMMDIENPVLDSKLDITSTAFELYWHYGTVLGIIPYFGIGGEIYSKRGFIFGFQTFFYIPILYIGYI